MPVELLLSLHARPISPATANIASVRDECISEVLLRPHITSETAQSFGNGLGPPSIGMRLGDDDLPTHEVSVRDAVIGERALRGERVREPVARSEIGGAPDPGGVGRRRMRLGARVLAIHQIGRATY